MSRRPSDKDRLERLDRRIDALETRTRRKPGARMDEGAGAGYRLVAELVSALLAGLGLGWLADQVLTPAPAGILVGVLVGAATGIYLVTVTASRMSARERARNGPAPDAPPEPDEDEA